MAWIWRWRGTLLTISFLALVLFWPLRRPEPDFVLASKSPDGQKWLVVNWNGSDGPVRVSEVSSGGRPVSLATLNVHSTTSIWGAWTPNSDGFSLLVCAFNDRPSITRFSVGDPFKGGTPDFVESDRRMAAAIRALEPTRAGTSNADAFEWACLIGSEAFLNRYVRRPGSAQVPFETERGQRVILWP